MPIYKRIIPHSSLALPNELCELLQVVSQILLGLLPSQISMLIEIPRLVSLDLNRWGFH